MKKKEKATVHAYAARKRIVVMLEKELIGKLKQQAFEADLSLQAYVSKLLERQLEK